MSFKGIFTRVPSNRLAGCMTISFSLKCTNWLQSETIDVGLFPADGSQPWFFRDLHFKAGQTYEFNYDSIDWFWCQGDYVAILGKDNQIVEKWALQLKEYGPGECPECHGTMKCRNCRGKGYIYPPGRIELSKTCPQCGGTGTCQTCHIPRRKTRFGGGPSGLKPF